MGEGGNHCTVVYESKAWSGSYPPYWSIYPLYFGPGSGESAREFEFTSDGLLVAGQLVDYQWGDVLPWDVFSDRAAASRRIDKVTVGLDGEWTLVANGNPMVSEDCNPELAAHVALALGAHLALMLRDELANGRHQRPRNCHQCIRGTLYRSFVFGDGLLHWC